MKKKLPSAPSLLIKPTRNGRGIFATKTFQKNNIVFEVLGRKVTLEEDWLTRKDKDNTFRYNKNYYISPKGKIGDFLNHSCKPNSFVKKSGAKLFIAALRPIAADEEIFIDYSTILGDDDIWEMDCRCGEPACRDKIGQFSSLPKPLQAKYRRLGAVPSYIDPVARHRKRKFSKT